MFEIYNEDCFEVLKRQPEKSVDLVIADLPYGITQNKWDKAFDLAKLWQELYRVGKENTAYVMFASNKFTFNLANSNFKDFKYKYVWVKNVNSNFLNARKQPTRGYEEVLVFYKKPPVYNPQFKQGKPYKNRPCSHATDCYNKQKTYYASQSLTGFRYPNDVLNFKAVHNGGGAGL